MGMFDTVVVFCPSCNAENEFQSKAGECRLKRYKYTSVPQEIAISLAGSSTPCIACGMDITLEYEGAPTGVAMTVSTGNDYD
jgi:hypothetical protein